MNKIKPNYITLNDNNAVHLSMNEATYGGSLIKDGRGCGSEQRLITATNIATNGDKGHAKQRGK